MGVLQSFRPYKKPDSERPTRSKKVWILVKTIPLLLVIVIVGIYFFDSNGVMAKWIDLKSKLVRAQVMSLAINQNFLPGNLDKLIGSFICPHPVWYSDPQTGKPINEHITPRCNTLYQKQDYSEKKNIYGPAQQKTPNRTSQQGTSNSSISGGNTTNNTSQNGLCSNNSQCYSFGNRHCSGATFSVCGQDSLCHCALLFSDGSGLRAITCNEGCDALTSCMQNICAFNIGGRTDQ